MTDTLSMEQALDQAIRLLTDRFGEAKQDAAVQLASLLYSVAAREGYEGRRDEGIPLAGGQTH